MAITINHLRGSIVFRKRATVQEKVRALFLRGGRTYEGPHYAKGHPQAVIGPRGTYSIRGTDRFTQAEAEQATELVSRRALIRPIILDGDINRLLKGLNTPDMAGFLENAEQYQRCQRGPVFAGYFLVDLLGLGHDVRKLTQLYRGISFLKIGADPDLHYWEDQGPAKFLVGIVANVHYQLTSSARSAASLDRARTRFQQICLELFRSIDPTLAIVKELIGDAPATSDAIINAVQPKQLPAPEETKD